MSLDRRIVPFEVKAIEDEGRTFEGYGSVFGVLDTYADVVAKGAFQRTLKDAKTKGRSPALLWQHDPSKPVGVYTDMREDETGLYVKGTLADTQQGREAYALLKMGALSGLSIGFRTLKSKMDEETGVRTLTEIELWEVSLVTFPANESARVTAVKGSDLVPVVDAVIALLAGALSEREAERTLRDAGFSRDQSKHIIAKAYRDGRREAMPSREACEAFVTACKHGVAVLTGDGNGTHVCRSEGRC